MSSVFSWESYTATVLRFQQPGSDEVVVRLSLVSDNVVVVVLCRQRPWWRTPAGFRYAGVHIRAKTWLIMTRPADVWLLQTVYHVHVAVESDTV